MPPAQILNAPTRLMKDLGYGSGYAYDHDADEGFSGQNYFPDGMERQRFYNPVERGFEREVRKRLAYFERLRARRRGEASGGETSRDETSGGAVPPPHSPLFSAP